MHTSQLSMWLHKNLKLCHFIRHLVAHACSVTQPSLLSVPLKRKKNVLFVSAEQGTVPGVLPTECASQAFHKTAALGPRLGRLISAFSRDVGFEQNLSTATSYTRIYPSLK